MGDQRELIQARAVHLLKQGLESGDQKQELESEDQKQEVRWLESEEHWVEVPVEQGLEAGVFG